MQSIAHILRDREPCDWSCGLAHLHRYVCPCSYDTASLRRAVVHRVHCPVWRRLADMGAFDAPPHR